MPHFPFSTGSFPAASITAQTCSYVSNLPCIKFSVWPLPCHFAFLLQKSFLHTLSTFLIFTPSNKNLLSVSCSLFFHPMTSLAILFSRHQYCRYCFLWIFFMSYLSEFQCYLVLVDNFHLENFPLVLDIIHSPGFSPASLEAPS